MKVPFSTYNVTLALSGLFTIYIYRVFHIMCETLEGAVSDPIYTYRVIVPADFGEYIMECRSVLFMIGASYF